MTLALRLCLYVAVTAGLFGSLAGGVWWLVTPDPSVKLLAVEARAAPIPPRIAESIERRVSVPVQEPQPVHAAPPPPPMQEANVALTAPSPVERKPSKRYGIVKVTRPARDAKPNGTEPPSVQTYVVPVVTTARTDVPF